MVKKTESKIVISARVDEAAIKKLRAHAVNISATIAAYVAKLAKELK